MEISSVSSQPSVWGCPPVLDELWASCSWEGSSYAAAAAMAGEGHRWSRFQTGSVPPVAPRTPSNGKSQQMTWVWFIQRISVAIKTQKGMESFLNLKKNSQWEKMKVLLSTENTSNKQDCGKISCSGAWSHLNLKDLYLSQYSEVVLQGGWDAGKFL